MLKNHNGENENNYFSEKMPMHGGKLIFEEIFSSYLHCKTPIIKRQLLNHMIN